MAGARACVIVVVRGQMLVLLLVVAGLGAQLAARLQLVQLVQAAMKMLLLLLIGAGLLVIVGRLLVQVHLVCLLLQKSVAGCLRQASGSLAAARSHRVRVVARRVRVGRLVARLLQVVFVVCRRRLLLLLLRMMMMLMMLVVVEVVVVVVEVVVLVVLVVQEAATTMMLLLLMMLMMMLLVDVVVVTRLVQMEAHLCVQLSVCLLCSDAKIVVL